MKRSWPQSMHRNLLQVLSKAFQVTSREWALVRDLGNHGNVRKMVELWVCSLHSVCVSRERDGSGICQEGRREAGRCARSPARSGDRGGKGALFFPGGMDLVSLQLLVIFCKYQPCITWAFVQGFFGYFPAKWDSCLVHSHRRVILSREHRVVPPEHEASFPCRVYSPAVPLPISNLTHLSEPKLGKLGVCN